MQQGKFRSSHSETLLSHHQSVSADDPTNNERGSVASLASAAAVDVADALNPFFKSQSDSVIDITAAKEAMAATCPATTEHFTTKTNGPSAGAAARIVTFASDRLQQQQQQPQSQPNLHPLPIQSGLSSMKRGFTNFMSTVDSLNPLKLTNQATGKTIFALILQTVL